jgi:hypothetical protein
MFAVKFLSAKVCGDYGSTEYPSSVWTNIFFTPTTSLATMAQQEAITSLSTNAIP